MAGHTAGSGLASDLRSASAAGEQDAIMSEHVGHRKSSEADSATGAKGAGCSPRRADLELPRPWRLILTAGWNLTESLGLPGAAYLVGARLSGQDAGMVAATVVIWLTAAVRKVAVRSVPGLLTISALVMTLQTALVLATGSELFFLLQFPLANLALCVLFARSAPTREPLVAQLAAEVVALRQPSSRHPGLESFFRRVTWLWAGIFALSTAGLAMLMVVESARVFLLLTTVLTVGGVVVGSFSSALWFACVLRRFGLHVRFAAA
jgi:hypothetical protein